MKRIHWSIALLLLVLVSCGTPASELQQEVASLRGDVSSLREQVNSLSAPEGTSTVTTSTTTVTPTTIPNPAVSTTSPLAAFPPELQEFTHGGEVWVVILAASEGFYDPVLETALIAATDAGYATGQTDCDFGASEALGLPEDRHYLTVSVYLSNEEDAIAAADAFAERGVGGVPATVQTLCLD